MFFSYYVERNLCVFSKVAVMSMIPSYEFVRGFRGFFK